MYPRNLDLLQMPDSDVIKNISFFYLFPPRMSVETLYSDKLNGNATESNYIFGQDSS